jgi:hypothetical protein
MPFPYLHKISFKGIENYCCEYGIAFLVYPYYSGCPVNGVIVIYKTPSFGPEAPTRHGPFPAMKIVKYLVILLVMFVGVYVSFSKTQAGVLVLQLAAQKNSPGLTRLFTSLGADVQSQTAEGLTPLHVAAFLGSDKVIEPLVIKGADVNALDNSGRTALHLAAYAGHATVAAGLIEQGANLEAREKENGMTPIHLAVVKGSQEVVRLLIDKGANLNATAKEEITPLLIANQEGKDEISDLLFENGGREAE